MGVSAGFVHFHRVLNRARWSSRATSRMLLSIADTSERRRGKRITAKGIDCDPVRSSRSHFVQASSRRWVSLMLLAPIPWAVRTWALPFLTVQAPSAR